MRITSFAILGAAGIALAGSPAFAGSDSYPDGPAQAIYASPPPVQQAVDAYQDVGRLSAPLSAATALNGSGTEAEPEFAGAPAMFGPANVAVARRAPRVSIGN